MITIRNMTLGRGRPKICVPLVSDTLDALEKECISLQDCPLDMLEWRVDDLLNMEGIQLTSDLEEAYKTIRKYFPDTPLLTTLRTKSQGGVHETTDQEYLSILSLLIHSHWADILDVEYGHEMLDTKVLISQAKAAGLTVLMSYHKFQRAMSETELIDTLECMKALKADILKIAVMPKTPKDTAALISAAARVGETYPDTPIITIGMGDMGQLTRLAGNALGAPFTFAAGKEASAPGQLTAVEVKKIFDVLYE